MVSSGKSTNSSFAPPLGYVPLGYYILKDLLLYKNRENHLDTILSITVII